VRISKGICIKDIPYEVVHVETIKEIKTQDDHPHIVLERLGLENAILAGKFAYKYKEQDYSYLHAFNMKRDVTKGNNWVICDSTLPHAYYIEKFNALDKQINCSMYYGNIKYYTVFKMQPRKFKGAPK
jgi:hypothetical protein